MANTIFIEPTTNIVVSIYDGVQTRDTLVAMTNQAKTYISQLRADQKPVLMLINTKGITNQDSGARAMAVEAINSLEYDKMAIFGANVFLKHVLSFMIQLALKKETVRYVDNEAEAREWLTQ